MSLNLGEVQFDLESPAIIGAGSRGTSFVPARIRRALHDGRIRACAVVACATAVALGFQGLTLTAIWSAILLASAWAVGIQAVEHSLRTVRVAAGRVGAAALSAGAGLALASTASFWLVPGLPRRFELFAMALFTFALLYALEAATVASSTSVPRSSWSERRATLELLEVLAADPDQPFSIVGIVDETTTADAIAGTPVLGGVDALESILEDVLPDLVVVAADRGRPEIFRRLADTAALGFRVLGLPEFYEHAFGRVPIRGMTDAWFMSILHLYQRPYSRSVKRGFDLAVAGLGLLVTAPIFPLVALMIRATGGPVFYRQTRLGEHGAAVHDPQVPLDAHGRRDLGCRVGCGVRPAHHESRLHPAPVPARRAPAAHQRHPG